MVWIRSASRMLFWQEFKSSVGKPVIQGEFYECQIVRNSLQNQSLNQLAQGSLPLLYVSSAAEWNSNKFPSVRLCSVEISMLIASSCPGWGSLQGLDFCLDSHAYLWEGALSASWKHLSGRSVYTLRMGGDNYFKMFHCIETEIIYVAHYAQMKLSLA